MHTVKTHIKHWSKTRIQQTSRLYPQKEEQSNKNVASFLSTNHQDENTEDTHQKKTPKTNLQKKTTNKTHR
jgi:hypothetical protein